MAWLARIRRPPLPATVSGIVAVVRLLPVLSKRHTAIYAIGMVISALAPIATAVLTGLLIGSIPATVRDGLDSAAGRTTTGLLIGIAVLVVVDRGSGPIRGTVGATLGRDLDRYLQERVLAAISRPVGIQHLEDSATLDEIRVVRGLGMDAQRPSAAVEALQGVLPAWLRALGSAAILLFFHWWLALLWLIMWPIMVFLMQREYLRVGQVGYGQSSALRRSEYLRDLAITAPAAKELRIWGMLDWLVDRFDSTWRSAIAPVWAARKPRLSIMFGTSGVIMVVNVLSFGLLAWAAIRGNLSLAAVAVFAQALINANSYTAFDDANANLSFAAVTVPKVLGLDARMTAVKGVESPTGSSARAVTTPSPLRSEIRFESVEFSYPDSEQQVLAGLDLTIPVGRSLAIVGANGAGKTSLVKLLCRMYEPTGGAITVDGENLTTIDPAAWRTRIAVLFQDFNRYHLSARDNITLGAPQRADDPDSIRAAADQAGILDTIENLPHGWETILSREYTNGTDLSGGQWQRIALARAMFAVQAGAKLLILDEPTAALDIRAEADLYDRFLDLTHGLTTILISHRFSTVRHANRIIVLNNGTITEDGTHDQLLAADGQYAHMFTLQAQRFRESAATRSDGDRHA